VPRRAWSVAPSIVERRAAQWRARIVSVNIQELRTLLDAATKTHGNRDLQPDLVAAIPGCTAHPVAEGDPRYPKAETYNCFTYVLELADSEDYRIITAQFTRLGADVQFMRYLVQNRILQEIPSDFAVANDIVVYFDNAEPQHAGKLYGTRVVSKWGDGLLWDHAVLEVPVIYGETRVFYRRLSREAAELAFAEYVASTLHFDPQRVQTLIEQRRGNRRVTPHAVTGE
jgi:hypothetical protein